MTRNQTARRLRLLADLAHRLGLFLAVSIICLPGAWIILSSLRPTVEIMAKPPVWIPQKLSFEAYTAMFGVVGQGGIPVWDYFRNSLIISISSTVIAIAIGMAGGYAFARLRFRGKSALFLGLMLTHTVPGIALSLPLFIIFARLGIIDTHLALIITYVALNVPFSIWLIDGFFRQVPRDLAEAAQIDGCTRWQAFWQVEFPLAGPGIASSAIFAFMTSWNEFALASQLTRSVNSKTLPVGLLDYTSEFTIDWRGMCALAVVMIAPAFALTFLIQKRLVSGLTFGAVKGWKMATVALEGLVKRYGQVDAVRAIDLTIADGEFVALVGPSGCGKSTTLRMIAGLEEVSAGTIRIGGEVVNDLPPRGRNISMVFQSYALYPHMSVRENMAFSLKIAKRPQAEIDARVAEASDILHLSDLLDRRPSQLSGGQRQRVAMGRAIVRKPEVFLFDEPLSNLDAKLRAQMRTEIKLLHARVPSTVIYVTHDQVEAMTLADRIVIMRDGLIEQIGAPDHVFRRPQSRFVAGFIGSPTMNLVDAKIDSGRIIFPGGDWLPLPDQFRNASFTDPRVAFGMRPDDVYPTGHGLPSAAGSQVVERELAVSLTEPLGNETLVFVPFGGRDWTARMLNPIPLEPGKRIGVSFDLAKAHLFATDGGHSITAKGG